MTKAKGVRKADDLMRRLVKVPKSGAEWTDAGIDRLREVVGKLPKPKKKGRKKGK